MKSADKFRRPDPPNFVYDAKTIVLHWLSAAVVAGQWIGGHTIDWFPRGVLRIDARSVHLLVGGALAVLILVRLHWRRTEGRKAPAADTSLDRLARLLHLTLYGLLLAAIVLGIGNACVRGDSLFGLFNIPRPIQVGPVLKHGFAVGHALAAYAIAVAVSLHVTAALFHAIVKKDGVMARMLPEGRSGRA